MKKYEKYQYFWIEKSALTRAMFKGKSNTSEECFWDERSWQNMYLDVTFNKISYEINPCPAEPVFTNSVDPDQLASSEANWSGSAVLATKYANL